MRLVFLDDGSSTKRFFEGFDIGLPVLEFQCQRKGKISRLVLMEMSQMIRSPKKGDPEESVAIVDLGKRHISKEEDYFDKENHE